MAESLSAPSPGAVSRRSLLVASLAGVTVAPMASLTAHADELVRDGATAPTFGPASRATSLLFSIVHDGRLYTTTRNVIPAKVLEYDLARAQVTQVGELPPSGHTTGDGAWAITAAGGKVYVGTYPDARVHCFDPADGSVRTLGQCGSGNTFVFSLAAGADGMLFASTYPDGALWQIDPASGATTKLGSPVTGAHYGRYVGAEGDRWVYLGVYLPKTLIRYDRYTSEFADIDPSALPNTIYGPFVTTDQYLYSVGGNRLVRSNLDGTGAVSAASPGGEGVGRLAVGPDGTVYGCGTRTSRIFRWVPGEAMTTYPELASASVITGLDMVGPTSMVGTLNTGSVFTFDTGSGKSAVIPLVNAGYDGAPEPVQSIASDPDIADIVYVGGNAGVQVHRPSQHTSFRIAIPGEAKTINVVEGSVYSGVYITGDIIKIDPQGRRYDVVANLGGGQVRPWEAKFHPGSRNLAFVSGPGTGQLVGALTLFDVDSHGVERYPNILPDESLMSVWVEGDTAYIGGNIDGGGSVTPIQPSAGIGAFDLRTRKLLWTMRPLPDARAIQSVAVWRGILYGVCRNPAGRWFTLDLSTRELLDEGSLPALGHFHASVGQLYLVTGGRGQIHRGAPGHQPKLLWDNIGNSWYTMPQLARVAGSNRQFWGLYQTELAQFDLDID